MSHVRLGVVGVGHLGKEHARILSAMPGVELVGVADTNREQAEAVALRTGARAFHDHRLLLPLVDAAVVVVPTTYHHAIAGDFLRHGLAVLVEKPIALDVRQATELEQLAAEQGTIVQVGHIERFNPAFEELARRPLQPKFVACERIGPFSGRSADIGVVLDLMIHDLDLLLALVGAPVRSVQALGVSVLGGHEDVVHAHLQFENGCMANVTASRVSPTPSRRMQVWGPEGFAAVDFAQRRLRLVQPSEQFRRDRRDPRKLDAAALAQLKADLHTRHLETIELDCNRGDQLTRELTEFVHCVRTGARPRVSAREGRVALAVAERILTCVRTHQWDGHINGPIGPLNLPSPLGHLFAAAPDQAAA